MFQEKEKREEKIKAYDTLITMLGNLYNEIEITPKLNNIERENLKIAVKKTLFFCISKIIYIKKQMTVEIDNRKIESQTYINYKSKFNIK